MAKKINLPFIIISTNTINQQLMELKEQGVQIPKLDITKSRCSLCNGEIISCNEQEVKELTPLGSQKQFHEFYYCNQCNQLYWEGSHWKRMRKTLKNL